MRRWVTGLKFNGWDSPKYVNSPKIEAFLADIGKVCEEHGFAISHEDGHGAFIVVRYSDDPGGLEAAMVDSDALDPSDELVK